MRGEYTQNERRRLGNDGFGGKGARTGQKKTDDWRGGGGVHGSGERERGWDRKRRMIRGVEVGAWVWGKGARMGQKKMDD